MLTRIGIIDFRIGSLDEGFNQDKIDQININQNNEGGPDCDKCVFQPYCGVDVVDKISRYNTLNYPTHQTYFCQFHMSIFEKIFELFSNNDIKFLKTAALHLGGSYALNPAFADIYYD